ncbi:MAG: hypothetical protein KBA96_01320 [Rhodocyclaceae bacterium]|nr:hypothetical protein [Rhodocyclaceae bacterium]
MRISTRLIALTSLCLAATPVIAQYQTPTEAQCREMVTGMLQVMRSTPLQTESERQQHRQLMDRVEKVVNDNRARPGSDCETWAAMSKIIATQ